MSLVNRIEAYILRRTGTTLSQLESLALQRGFSLDEVYTALETIHRNNKIRRTVSRGDVVYSPAPKPKEPGSHLTWLRQNYPRMDSTNDGSGIDVGDMSWMFLKTKEERDAYKAAAKGVPKYMLKSRHG